MESSIHVDYLLVKMRYSLTNNVDNNKGPATKAKDECKQDFKKIKQPTKHKNNLHGFTTGTKMYIIGRGEYLYSDGEPKRQIEGYK